MNLFIMSKSQQECSQYMMDKHIVKIILEAVQMLCTCKILYDEIEQDKNTGNYLTNDEVILYKPCHINHPVTKWIRESYDNWKWTIKLCEEMHKEWLYRYNHPEDKAHKSYLLAKYLKHNPPQLHKFPMSGLTPFAQAMPDCYKQDDAISAYKAYYMSPEKQKIASWKKREVPVWYIKN